LADLDADVVKLTSALSEATHDLGKERAHRQDLQHSLVDYDRKLAALVSERERLLLDREGLQVEEDKRKEQIEHLQKGEQHAKKSEAQSQEMLHRLQLEMQQMQQLSDAATSQRQHEILRCTVVMDQLMDSHDECHKLVEALEMDLHALSLLQQEPARGRKQAQREDVAAQLSPTAPQQDANFEPVGDWEIRPLSFPSIPSLPSGNVEDMNNAHTHLHTCYFTLTWVILCVCVCVCVCESVCVCFGCECLPPCFPFLMLRQACRWELNLTPILPEQLTAGSLSCSSANGQDTHRMCRKNRRGVSSRVAGRVAAGTDSIP
jgi:hypothetical protein